MQRPSEKTLSGTLEFMPRTLVALLIADELLEHWKGGAKAAHIGVETRQLELVDDHIVMVWTVQTFVDRGGSHHQRLDALEIAQFHPHVRQIGRAGCETRIVGTESPPHPPHQSFELRPSALIVARTAQRQRVVAQGAEES